ncbi:MAG TPA: FKBP-type peptidyl-prolyl cis-trans isomerase [Thermoplasmatales archaeon]|nr:FKBP-type peptidyl-prolyl cis-trans isomerase [Thermoplasmatales archaeon]
MQEEQIAVIALVVIIIGVLGFYLTTVYGGDILENIFPSKTEVVYDKNTVQLGDCVEVNYIGRFHSNGTVFDTTYEDVAKEWGIYDENRTYEPIKIFVDPEGTLVTPEGYENYTSNMIPGFLEALVGMKKGENKTVSIPPEKAYGIWNTSLAEEYGLSPYPIDYVVNDTQMVEKTLFTAYFPDVNLTVNNSFDWGEKMIGVNDTLYAVITNVTDTNVTYRLLPVNGTTFPMPLFNWTVTILVKNETHFTLHTSTEVGYTTSINLMYGYLHIKVVDMNETHLKLAINTEAPSIKFVGQTLDFTIEVVDLHKTSLEEES